MENLSPLIVPSWVKRRKGRSLEVVRDFEHYASWGNSPADPVFQDGAANVVNGLERLSLDLPGQAPSYGLWAGDAAGEDTSFVSSFDGESWSVAAKGLGGGRPWLGGRKSLECRASSIYNSDTSYFDLDDTDYIFAVAFRVDQKSSLARLCLKTLSGSGFGLWFQLGAVFWFHRTSAGAITVSRAVNDYWTLLTVWGDRDGDARMYVNDAVATPRDISSLSQTLSNAAEMYVGGKSGYDLSGAIGCVFAWKGAGIASISQAEQQAIHDQWQAELFGRGDYVIRRAMASSRGLVFGQVTYVDVRDVTVDADCEVYVKNQSGSGLVAWGSDAPRLAEGGLFVHPDVSNLLPWSEGYFSSEWTASDADVTDHYDDSADGLHSAALISEAAAPVGTPQIYQEITTETDWSYIVAADMRRRAEDYEIVLFGVGESNAITIPTTGAPRGANGYEEISPETVRVFWTFSENTGQVRDVGLKLSGSNNDALLERIQLIKNVYSYSPA